MTYAAVAGWAVDFVRAARERNTLMRLLLRVAMGKHAYRELIGLMDELDRQGMCPYFRYGCASQEYHADPVPFDWATEREPMPKKVFEQ